MIMKCFKKEVEFELLLERFGKAYPKTRGAERKREKTNKKCGDQNGHSRMNR